MKITKRSLSLCCDDDDVDEEEWNDKCNRLFQISTQIGMRIYRE